jgi:hypothetical protein
LVAGLNLLFPWHHRTAHELAGLRKDLLEVVVIDGSGGHGSSLFLRLGADHI